MVTPTPNRRRRRRPTRNAPLARLGVLSVLLLLSLPGPPQHVAAFGQGRWGPLTTPARTREAKSSKCVSVGCSLSGGATAKYSSSNDDTDSQIFRQAAVVGTVTAAMGYAYGRVLDATVRGVWTKLPSLLAASSCSTLASLGGSSRYILCTMSIGGLLMGILSSKLKPSYIVAEFVSTMSRKKGGATSLPPLLPVLPNLLVLSLVTSTFGFSVGPEAPMVCAGGLIGAALARRWGNGKDGNDKSDDDTTYKKEILAYAGAAGSLTAFMGIPLAGPIFALELTRASSGMSSAAKGALGPAVAASAAALLLIRGLLKGGSLVGGHFSYGAIEALSGRAAMTTSLLCGIGGAVLGTCFHKFVHILKDVLWSQAPSKNESEKSTFVNREVVIKTIVGVLVGLLSMMYPQTMFWGEGSLQCVVDGHKTPFAATKHGLSNALTGYALVDPSMPFQSALTAAQVGFAKLLSISLACAGKFPGGIIFPLFFAAAPIAHAVLMVLSSKFPTQVVSSATPMAIMCLMASTQASVTRTPLATIFMLALSAAPATPLSVMLPSVILSSYIGVWFSRYLSRDSYFDYSS